MRGSRAAIVTALAAGAAAERWGLVLRPHDAARTRLVMRARVRYVPVWPSVLVRAAIGVGFGVGDVIQAGGMLEGIRRRADR